MNETERKEETMNEKTEEAESGRKTRLKGTPSVGDRWRRAHPRVGSGHDGWTSKTT